jgi:arylsulfatase A-like enzyme
MPTIATMAGVANRSTWTFMGKDLMPIVNDAIQNPGNPSVTVQENTLYTFDDETAGAENGQNIVTQPNHIRCLREARWKYAIYFDPNSLAPAQYELYDLETDPFEEHNCADPANTLHYNPEQVAVMHAKILAKMVETNTLPFRAWLPVVNR